jgi:AAA+ ATPase superfamily predicted ATPase
METPFVFGKIASHQDFTDRVVETQHLLDNFRGLVNTVLISPRRWGKSSLVAKASEIYAQESDKNIVVHIDLFNCRTVDKFYETFAKELISATNTVFEEFVSSSLKYLSRFAPNFQASDPAGSFELSFGIDIRDKKMSFDEILDLPQTIAREKGKHIIVCIDEFQTIKDYDDSFAFQCSLRAHWQKHQDVAYCLFGSKRNMMIDLFADSQNPFYKFGDLIFLQKIASEDWVKFIIERFEETGKYISEEVAFKIAQMVECHPYYVQQLSQLSWFRTHLECTEDIVKEAFSSLCAQLSLVFSHIIDGLTPSQIGFLQAVADGVSSFTSQAVLAKYRLGSSANVKNIKQALEKKELIDIQPGRIEIQDPVLKFWMLREYRK